MNDTKHMSLILEAVRQDLVAAQKRAGYAVAVALAGKVSKPDTDEVLDIQDQIEGLIVKLQIIIARSSS